MTGAVTLEERIRDLCARAVSAENSEAEAILAELRAALREHITFARKMTLATMSRDLHNPPAKSS